MNENISVSAKILENYNNLLQDVKKRWHGSACNHIGISESKASRILT